MGVKERILTIRLMEKAIDNPAYAETLGIFIVNDPAEPEKQTVSNSAGNQS